jgi:hypothetical protein
MKTNDPPKRGDPKGNVKLHVYYIGTAMWTTQNTHLLI